MLEDCIADHLACIPNQQGAEALLSVMGARGSIDKGGRDAENIKKWAALDAVFTAQKATSLGTDLIIATMSAANLPDHDVVVGILKNHKERYKHRILGELLSTIECLGPFQSVIGKLKEGWFDRSKLGHFQMQTCGTCAPYAAPQHGHI